MLLLTVKERILVLSDVARGETYLHSEVHVINRDVKSASRRRMTPEYENGNLSMKVDQHRSETDPSKGRGN